MKVFSILINVVVTAAVNFNMQCYSNSDSIGLEQGVAVTDRETLKANIQYLSADWRSAGIKTCTSTDSSNIYGHQLAIADYSALDGQDPTSADIFWMPGVGTLV